MRQAGVPGELSICFAGSVVGKSSSLSFTNRLMEKVHPAHTVNTECSAH